MRLHRLTAEGPLLMQLTLMGGKLTIEEGPPEGPLAVLETIEREAPEEGRALLEAKVAELKKNGAIVPIAPDVEAKAYFDGPFFERLTKESKARKKKLDLLAPLEARYGCRFPDDLRRLLGLVETHAVSGFGEWTNLGEAFTPYKEGKNLLEQAIDLDRKNYLGTAVREILSCLVPIGYAGNGDVYFAFVDAARFEGCEIFLWDHEEQSMRVFADSLSTLAYLNHLYEIDGGDVQVEGDVLDVTRAGLRRLEKRVAPSWHYRALCENAGVSPTYEGVTGAEFLYYRATWVHALLRNKGTDAAVQAKALVGPNLEKFHQTTPFSSYLGGPRIKRSPAHAYWLFYTYFFDDTEGFAQAVDALSSSASTFVRDTAELFAPLLEVKAKTKTKVPIGKIPDAVALKKKFLAAETGGARQARLQAEKEKAESAKAGLFAEADAIGKGASAERLVAAIEENKEKPVVVERLFEHLAALDPEIVSARKRLDVLADGGRYREHRIANTWLAMHATRRIVPLVEARGMKGVLAVLQPPAPPPAAPPPEITREGLLPLRTEASRKLQVAMVASGTEAHLALFDELLAARRGRSVFIVFERLMREALASRLGKPVDLDVVRRALGVTYSDRERTEILHRTALGVLAAHAPKEETEREALRFMTWDLAGVRAAARSVLTGLGVKDQTRIIDSIEAEEIVASGAPAVRAALRDPWAYPKSMLIDAAREKGMGEAIADDAIAAFKATYAPFGEGHGYYSGNYDVMLRTAKSIASIPGANVDAFIHFLVTSRSPLLSPAIDDAETKDRARTAGSLEREDESGELTLTSFSAPPYVVGGTVHGIARAGEHVIAAGPRSVVFDEAGRGHPLPGEVRFGWAHDVDVDPTGNLAAIGYHACHLVVLDVAKNEIVLHLQLGGVPSGIRKVKFSPSGRFVATASDDESIHVVDLGTKASVMSHREPYDVNGVAWIDDDQLVFITDHHVGILPRTGGEPKRLDVGGGADVIVHEGSIVATTTKHGITWIDPKTLKTKRKIPQKSVARVRIGPDGAVWAAIYEGEYAGLVCFPPGENATSPITGEPMFALDLDANGDLLCGGKAGRIHRVKANGQVEPPPEASHTGGVIALTLEGDTVLALDATARALRWSLADRKAVAPWGVFEPLFSPHSVVETNGDAILGAFKKTSRLGPSGAVWEVDTERSESMLLFGDELVIGDGKNLHWLDAKTGASLAKVPAEVKSSWIAQLFAIDGDTFLVAGYDDPKLARWSVSKRAAEHTVAIDRRHEDARYSRVYGMTLAPKSRRLYASAWNETVDVIDPRTLDVLTTYDVAYSYEWLAVDEDERWLLLATSTVLDLVDLRTGARVARRTTSAPITSLVIHGPGRALVGLGSGELMTAMWPALM